MPDYALPFPNYDLAKQELSYDPCYGKIPESDRERITESAWSKGKKAAQMVFDENDGNEDFFFIAKRSGLVCKEVDKDYVAGNQRYFSDYIAGQGQINLYLKSIELWAEQNNLTLKDAENVILSHEYFHFLEWTRLGLTSHEYQVHMFAIGALKIGKTGIRALSEIGAHAFAHTYYQLINEKERKNEA